MAEKKAVKPAKEVDYTSDGVKINNDVICVVAALAAIEVEGVYNVGSGPKNKKNISKGVKVKIQDSNAICDVSLSVNFGENIKEVATKVQQNVKRSIESMLGLTVATVNVHVIGVDFSNAPVGMKSALATK